MERPTLVQDMNSKWLDISTKMLVSKAFYLFGNLKDHVGGLIYNGTLIVIHNCAKTFKKCASV